MAKHEFLKKEDYYETKKVGVKGRKDKHCEYCHGPIPKGMQHEVHHFYPEFLAYPTHIGCTEPFMESLLEGNTEG